MISIHSELSPDLVPVNAVAAQVEQILLNLSTNAAQAMPQGGQLSFHTSNTSVGGPQGEDQPALVPCAYMRLEVSDTGLGMDEQTR